MSAVPIIQGLRTLAPRYQVLLCDIWGVVHNGRHAFEGVVDCLKSFRKSHGTVLLLSNAPRPGAPIREQLQGFGVPPDAYDTIVTSGDLTRKLLAERSTGSAYRIHHVGPDRDLTLFEGLNVSRVKLEDASAIVCTGPFDDNIEGPDDYKTYWQPALKRKTPFLCANPDLVVQRGDQLVYCAGALAEDYARQGGNVTFLGKPHLPVYDFVADRLNEITGAALPRSTWLAIGDGLKTDILGAKNAGIDALLITGGIHESELADATGRPDSYRIEAVMRERHLRAVSAMRRLVW
ncbi:MAG: TIGR01459 family HAD-type hydrolase [Micropepsaceae bacterium]